MRLHWLKVRYFFGWGHSIDHLRFRAHMCFVGARLTLIAFLAMGVLFFTVYWSEVKRITIALAEVQTRLIPLGVIATVLLLLLVLSRIYQARLARDATKAGVERVTGQCHALLTDAPFRLFARIGFTPETAHWYVMPIQWDILLKPNGDSLEIEAYPSTGFVTQLRSIGARRLELTSEIAPDQEAYATATTATRQAPRETRRYIREVWLRGWGASPQIVLWEGLAGTLLFVMFGIFPFSLFLVPLLSPRDTYRESLLAFLALLPLTVAGWLILVWSITLIRTGRRGLRSRGEPTSATEGVIAFALANRDCFSKAYRPSVYIELHTNDESHSVFRIPSEFAHRVPLGARVRVECMPTTEVVTNVTLLEPDVSE